MKNQLIQSVLKYGVAFILGVAATYCTYRIYLHQCRILKDKRFYYPIVTSVSLDSTNLPIIFINTGSSIVEREKYITAKMKILDNGAGQYNYGDTMEYKSQKTDYDGYIAFRYRGNSSFGESEKKPYAIRAIDKPLEDGGEKVKAAFLGMRKGKKWALLAPYSDRSLIRDALTFELAKSYMDYVPQIRFCELILNGFYMGVYILTEQVSADRLKIGKPNKKGNDVTGGYLFQIDRRKTSEAHLLKNAPRRLGIRFESPDKEKLTSHQMKYVSSLLDSLDDMLTTGTRNEWVKMIDELSFVDFQLVEEFAFDTDGYSMSSFLYKHNDKNNGKFKMTIWDFNVTYGNCNVSEGWRTDKWQYKRAMPKWWAHMMENVEYRDRLKQRWREYREGSYSKANVEHVIDSMVTTLTVCGAEKRNAIAWRIWNCSDDSWKGPKYIWPNKYISSSYEDEIDYLKKWIGERTEWMDAQLGFTDNK